MRLFLLPLLVACAGCELLIGFDLPPESGDQCSDGIDNDGNGLADCDDPSCASVCNGMCGNGRLDPGEQCDDGNKVDGDGCESDCKLPTCGNGKIDGAQLALMAATPIQATSAVPVALAAADLDGDGRQDLLVVDQSASTVRFYSNLGGGAYAEHGSQSVGNNASAMPVAIAAGDWSGDGLADFVTVNAEMSLSFVRNLGVAGFSSISLDLPFVPSSVALGDVGLDGQLDILIGGAHGEIGLSQNPSGDPMQPMTSTVGTGAMSVAIADLDGDGFPDVIFADAGASKLYVLLNVGGMLSPANVLMFDTPSPSSAVAVGDLDGDGRLDVVVASATQPQVTVLLNTSGAGTINLTALTPLVAGGVPSALVVADLDGDGAPDAAIATGGAIETFTNRGASGMLTREAPFALGRPATSLIGTFIDGDGRLDLAVADPTSPTVALAQNVSTAAEQCDGGPACTAACQFGTPSDPTAWARQLGGSGNDVPYDLAIDPEGNLYVAGSFDGPADFGDGQMVTPVAGTDLFVASYSPSGMFRWKATYGSDTDDVAAAVVYDPVTRRVVVGGNGGGIDFGVGSFAPGQYYLLALDPATGAAQAATGIGGGAQPTVLRGMSEAGGVIAVGGAVPNATGGMYDPFVTLYSPIFEQLGGITLASDGTSAANQVMRVIQGSDGTTYALGEFAGMNTGLNLTSAGGTNLFLAAVTPFSSVTWARPIAGSGDLHAEDLAIDPWGNLLVTGEFSKDLSAPVTTTNQGGLDALVAKFSGNGNFIWLQGAGTPGDDGATAVSSDWRGFVTVGGLLPVPGAGVEGGSVTFARELPAPVAVAPFQYAARRFVRDVDGHLFVVASFAAPVPLAGTVYTSRGRGDVLLVRLR